jgi:hypothetical protein
MILGCIGRHRKPGLKWPPLLLAKQDIGARLAPLDNVIFFIYNGVYIADSRYLYLPAPPCFLAKARTGVTQAQVRKQERGFRRHRCGYASAGNSGPISIRYRPLFYWLRQKAADLQCWSLGTGTPLTACGDKDCRFRNQQLTSYGERENF